MDTFGISTRDMKVSEVLFTFELPVCCMLVYFCVMEIKWWRVHPVSGDVYISIHNMCTCYEIIL